MGARETPIMQAIYHHVGAHPAHRLWRIQPLVAQDPETGRVVVAAPKGIADLVGIRRTTCQQCGAPGPGQLIALEVKAPGGRPRPDQVTWGAAVTMMGGLYVVPHSVTEACELLGLPPPAGR